MKSKGAHVPESRYRADDPDWKEHLDDTPVETPTRLKLPQRQVDRVREIIRREMSAQAAEQGWESFEEADDFELPDEEPISAYEEVFEPALDRAIMPSRGNGAAVKENGNGAGNVDGSRAQDSVVRSESSVGSVGSAEGAAEGVAGSSVGAGSAGKGGK